MIYYKGKNQHLLFDLQCHVLVVVTACFNLISCSFILQRIFYSVSSVNSVSGRIFEVVNIVANPDTTWLFGGQIVDVIKCS